MSLEGPFVRRSLPDSDQTESVVRQLRAQIDALQTSVAELKESNNDLASQTANLMSENALLRSELRDMKRVIDSQGSALRKATHEIEELVATLSRTAPAQPQEMIYSTGTSSTQQPGRRRGPSIR